MQQPNPWILFMGGIALINVALMVGGLRAPAWARYPGMAAGLALGLLAMGLGLRKYFEKKPPRPKYVPRRRKTGAAPKRPPGDARPPD